MRTQRGWQWLVNHTLSPLCCTGRGASRCRRPGSQGRSAGVLRPACARSGHPHPGREDAHPLPQGVHRLQEKFGRDMCRLQPAKLHEDPKDAQLEFSGDLCARWACPSWWPGCASSPARYSLLLQAACSRAQALQAHSQRKQFSNMCWLTNACCSCSLKCAWVGTTAAHASLIDCSVQWPLKTQCSVRAEASCN